MTPRTFAFESQSAAGLRDVGVNLGLSYDWTKTWAVASEIGYARSLGEGPAGGQTPATGEFFGTIVLNYRF